MDARRNATSDLADAKKRLIRAQARHTQAVERKRKAVEQNDQLEVDIQNRIKQLDQLKKRSTRLKQSIVAKQNELARKRRQSAAIEAAWNDHVSVAE